jgi:UDP-N-acetylglucosamine 4,6-dehydratase
MTYVVIGGTGTLGSELMRQLLQREPAAKIVCFSRDELKQYNARAEFPSVKFVIGDIKDRTSVKHVMRGAHSVFHFAAMKHIDACEANPLEAIKTNLLGTLNVVEAAQGASVPFVVFSNTDKAVLPITTYGYTKALAQNCVLHANTTSRTKFSVFNWGNVIASRGSVVQCFVRTLLDSGQVNITDLRMTRFWLRIEDAATFILERYKAAPNDRAVIPPCKAAYVTSVAESIARILGVKKPKVNVTGLRGTEKLYEVLESTHGGCIRSDTCERYTAEELDSLLRDIVQRLANEHKAGRATA